MTVKTEEDSVYFLKNNRYIKVRKSDWDQPHGELPCWLVGLPDYCQEAALYLLADRVEFLKNKRVRDLLDRSGIKH